MGGDLTELRSFHSFAQGEYITGCPPKDHPDRHDCKEQYPCVIGEFCGQNLDWLCPWRSWHFDFGDRSQAHWGWKNIEKYHVDQNWITGTIPDDIGSLWPHLRTLDLHQNKMT